MRRLIINEPGLFVGVKRGMIVVKRGGEEVLEVAPPHVSQVAITTRGAALSTALLRLLARHRIDLIIYSGVGFPVARLASVKVSGAVKLRKAQYRAQGEKAGAYLAKKFAWAKVVNQKELLGQAGRNRVKSDPELARELLELSREISAFATKIDEIEGESADAVRKEVMRLEAEAAEVYWRGFKLLLPENVEFPGRRKRSDAPTDPVNISLNFCYGLLAAEVLLAVERSGLDPYAGFLHADSPRRPALAMDLVEEFRQPVADRVVLRTLSGAEDPAAMVEGRKLKRDGRLQLLKAFSERLSERVTFAGRSLPISSHILLQARRVAEFLMGRATEYEPFTTG